MAKKKAKSGRHRLTNGEKKIGVTLYIKEKTIKKHGGRTGTVIAINERLETNPL